MRQESATAICVEISYNLLPAKNFFFLSFISLMYIYNVTVKINHFQADKWLRWMRAIHIPTVMATGYFTKNRIFRFIDEGNIEGVTFAIQFTCKNLDDYFAYKTNYAPAMQKQHNQKFEGQFVATRILMEVLD